MEKQTVSRSTLELSDLKPSKTNPRTHFDKDALAELTESVRRLGVLQPILVRPLNGFFEVVAGERRYRAAKAAGLKEIPVVARVLTDLETLEVQVIENLQREDLSPLEEAEGYRKLCKEHDCRVEDLVIKIGKSRSYVYARLKLASLPKIAKKAMWDEILPASTALLIARIPDPKLREKAAKQVIKGPNSWNPGPMSYRRAAEFIHNHYMLRLKDAPFSTTDGELLPKAGACVDCPKRTGNQRDLFPDIKSADVCTDPKCFDQKQDVHWKQVAKKAEASGKRVLSQKEAKQAFPHGAHWVSDKYVDLKANNYQGPKTQTYKKLLGKECPQIIVARDPDGEIRQLVDAKEAERVLRQKYKWASERRRTAQSASDRAERQKQKVKKAVVAQAIEAVIGKVKKSQAELKLWKYLATHLVDHSYWEVCKEVAARRGLLEKGKGWRPEDALAQLVDGMKTIPELKLFVFEILVTRGSDRSSWSNGHGKGLEDACKLYGVDLKAIQKSVKMGESAKKKAKAKKKTTKKKRRKNV